MAAISLILTGTGLTTKVRADTIAPMLDLACYSYLARCSATYSALRCLLVAAELLRVRGGGAADEAAVWAIRAREMVPSNSIGHVLITERVGACYNMREGIGSGAWGARKRKAAMWRMLAAGEWLEVGKLAQSRRCLDATIPVFERSGFSQIRRFMEHVKNQAGYAPLVSTADGGVGDLEIHSEMLDAGLKRKSLIGREQLELESEGDDEFVDS